MDNTYTIDEKEYMVVKPTGKQIRESKKIYNQSFAVAVRSGAYLRANIRELAKKHDIWTDKQENELRALRAEVDKYVNILNAGGIDVYDARNYAIKINSLRNEILELIGVLNDLDQLTAEGQAQDEAKNYLLSQCIVYKDTKKPYCANVEDLYAKEDDPVVMVGIAKYVQMENQDSLEMLKSLPEIKFLKEFNFMDDNYNYINEEGQPVDADGNLVQTQDTMPERKPFLKNGEPING